jgi:hypothetical protein
MFGGGEENVRASDPSYLSHNRASETEVRFLGIAAMKRNYELDWASVTGGEAESSDSARSSLKNHCEKENYALHVVTEQNVKCCYA